MAEVSEECRLALAAAMDLIGEKCKVTFPKTIELYGAKVTVPPEVAGISSSNPELTREERIKAVSESAWARGWGKGMCELVSPGLIGREREECIDRMARTLAERVV